MNTTLVSFLGRARQDPKTGYRSATYRFPDGAEQTTPFFGLALRRVLAPDRLVLLGTRGSMWDALIEHLAVDGEDEDLRLQLIDACTHGAVGEALLDRVTPLVQGSLAIDCVLRLIPFGRDQVEQAAILESIATAVPQGRVVLDLTHGFRHLAALGLSSAFFLERLRRLDIAGLYYGALDMTEQGITPVIRLDGLLAIQRWIDALDRFDQNGDYSVFAGPLIADGVPEDKARCLSMAAFHERTFNLADAVRKIRSFLPALDEGLPGTSGLFQAQLGQRLAWARSGGLADHQRCLARFHLDRQDFVRAAVFGWEAIITAECDRYGLDNGDFSQSGGREQAERSLRERLGADGEQWHNSPQNRLKAVRNALAHGNPPPWKTVRKALGDPGHLYRMLDDDLRSAFE